MTFKEELDAQRKRLEEAQKRYFASQPKMEKERAAHHGGDPEPKLIRPGGSPCRLRHSPLRPREVLRGR
jgi:hypothetical protein